MNAQRDQWDCGCIPDRACERTGCPVGLDMDQESIVIALVYVGVCEGDVDRLDSGFVLLQVPGLMCTFICNASYCYPAQIIINNMKKTLEKLDSFPTNHRRNFDTRYQG